MLRFLIRNYAFGKSAITVSARTGGDDPDSDAPRVANSNRKQPQHTDSHKGEAALRVVEYEDPAQYKESVCRKWKNRVMDQVMFEVILLIAGNSGPRVN